MNKKYLKELSKSLMFDLDDKVLAELTEKAESMDKEIKLLQSVNTDDVEPMDRINEKETLFLREDECGQTMSKDVLLKNAPSTQGDFIEMKKVFKNV